MLISTFALVSLQGVLASSRMRKRERGRVEGLREEPNAHITQRRETLVLYKSCNTLCPSPFFYDLSSNLFGSGFL
jgi:hypothetical protein